MEEFYIANIPEKPILEEAIEKTKKDNKTGCIVIGILSLTWAILRAFWYWLNSRHSSAPDGWFLVQFLWTGLIIGAWYVLNYLIIKEKQGKLDRLIHEIKDKIGTYFYIGRRYTEKKDSEIKQKTDNNQAKEQSTVDMLIDLNNLYDGGLLTQEEFDEQVRQLRGKSETGTNTLGMEEIVQEELRTEQKPSNGEQEYLDIFKEYAADGEISERDRKMLEKFRERIGISVERAREIEESFLNPQLTEAEKEYFELFMEYAADGEISERDRRMLNKMREKMALSEEQVRALEEFVISSTEKA